MQKKIIALILALSMVAALFVGCQTPATDDPGTPTEAPATNPDAEATEEPITVETFEGDFTYQDSVSVMATNWNPHTYQTQDDAYPSDTARIRIGLYDLIFNDEIHPVEGKEPFAGYVVLPEMAASLPVDVTEQVKAEHPEFNIPEDMTSGYAYTIDLNPDACWEDGTPINADTYVYSMQKLLDPKLLNYRATDYYAQNFSIAGAEEYANAGRTVDLDNYAMSGYTLEDLTLGEDGQYVSPEGSPMFVGVNFDLSWTAQSGGTLQELVEASGDQYFNMERWEELVALADENGLAPLTEDSYAMLVSVISTDAWMEDESNAPCYFVERKTYPEVDFSTVGLYKSGDYQITLVLDKALAGFNLYYSLTSNWIVKEDLYESCLTSSTGADGVEVWSSTYNTSVETTSSYGPYKLVEFQTDKFMRYEKNENWYGWTDGKHIYKDPVDGKYYPMYQTTAIECEVVEEADTRKLMFLKGELMGYGLQTEDFDTYRNSDYCYATPAETIFFLILNGYLEAIQNREAAADFDQSQYDLETMTVLEFRKAVALTYDKELFAATVSPARSGGYGVIGSAYVWDVETGSLYRDTDQAKQALCNAYSVDVSQYASLDEAAASITGYDPEAAKEFYAEAFTKALEAGYITDEDGDGISDQTVRIEYCISADSTFMTQTIDYLNEKMAEVTAGTPFEGKVQFVKSAPYGTDWSNKIKQGLSDTVLGGWAGSVLDPFGLSDLYVNPSYQYDAAWFDATTVSMTLDVEVDGEVKTLTMNLRQWSDALNGLAVTADDGNTYNFGNGMADPQVRLTILAGIETQILGTYNYLPMLQEGSMALLSQQVYYVIEEYNPILGRGGIQYLKYNYNDTEWAAYVAENGGELTY